ncbi:HXXEE domain-containing protein [Paenibacillus sonchi]|uniref:HXXEE domain-containing protein n=1 Tax=Paenibacillus sonchi TaxID=373687 RepID=UPI000303E330|nr:HXXEE domain-containing protein [Paenibacillus sonchi]
MIHWLNLHIDQVSLLWLLPILFMFHDFEEILTVESWGIKYGPKVEAALPPGKWNPYRSMLRMTTRNFAADVLFVYIVVVAVTCTAVFFSFYWLYLAVLAVFLLHVFTHLGQSMILKIYTPGVVTAVLIALPYSSYAFYRLLKENTVSWVDVCWSLLLMALLAPAIVWRLVKSRQRHQPE